jgi:hypothetical protein
VTEFKAAGVPLVLLDPTAFLKAAKEGNVDAIRICLDCSADIETKDDKVQ